MSAKNNKALVATRCCTRCRGTATDGGPEAKALCFWSDASERKRALGLAEELG